MLYKYDRFDTYCIITINKLLTKELVHLFNRSKMKLLIVMLTIVTLVCAWPMSAAVAAPVSHHPILLKLNGIKGESQDGNSLYKDAIEINSFSFGVTNPVSVLKGGGGGAGKAKYTDFSLTKYLDSASLTLLKNLASGHAIQDGTLYFFKTGQDKPYLTIQLNEIFVTSQQQGVTDSDDRMSESITLMAAQMTFTYTQYGTDGRVVSTQTVAIDQENNTVH